MHNTKPVKTGFLAAMMVTTALCGVAIPTRNARAAASVSGVSSCVMAVGGSATYKDRTEPGDGGINVTRPWVCNEGGRPVTVPESPGFPEHIAYPWYQAKFVTADEVNAALDQAYRELGSAYDPSKDNEQDGRLQRLEGGAVMYNRDGNGNKTGGVTLNDGSGGPVRIGNVAAGIAGNDSVNVNQLTGAFNGLGGGSRVNGDGSVTAPTYHIDGNNYNNVGDALGNLDNRVTNINGNITNVINGTAGLVQQDAGSPGHGNITVGKDTGGTVVNIAGQDGDRTITGVSAGKADNDAVNVGQLTGALDGLGGGAKVNSDGSVTAPTYNIGGNSFHNVGDALGNLDNRVTVIDDRVTNIEGNLTNIINGTAGLVQQDGGAPGHGDITIGKDTGGTVVNIAGQDGDRTITGVLAGKAENDATNVGQLTAALDGLGGGATVNEDGTVTGPTYNIGGATYNNVGAALSATNKLGVQYAPDEHGNPTNKVLLAGDGTGTPVTISNLADGVNDTDAVNVRQLHTAQNASVDYTDQQITELRDYSNGRFNALSGEISATRQEARAGIASAMAAAGLRFDDRPGKASIAAGMGGFKTSTAFAAGVGYTSEDGRWRTNAELAHSFATRDTSWNMGASWTFN